MVFQSEISTAFEKQHTTQLMRQDSKSFTNFRMNKQKTDLSYLKMKQEIKR